MTPEIGLYKVVNEFYTNDPSRRKHHVGDLVLLIECSLVRRDIGTSVDNGDPYVYRVAFLANDGIVCCRMFTIKIFPFYTQKTQ